MYSLSVLWKVGKSFPSRDGVKVNPLGGILRKRAVFQRGLVVRVGFLLEVKHWSAVLTSSVGDSAGWQTVRTQPVSSLNLTGVSEISKEESPN